MNSIGLGWHSGRVEVEDVVYRKYDTHWSFDNEFGLHISFQDERVQVSSYPVARDVIFEGRQGVLFRGREEDEPLIGLFIDFPTHYVCASLPLRDCWRVLRREGCPLAAKPVLCEFDYGHVAALYTRRTNRNWVGAVHRLPCHAAHIPPTRNRLEPTYQAQLRKVLKADRTMLEDFLTDPLANLANTTTAAILSRDGRPLEGGWPCTFTGLLPTPTVPESLRLKRALYGPSGSSATCAECT